MAQNYKKILIYAKKSHKNLHMSKKSSNFAVPFEKSGVISRSRAVVPRQAHNLKVGGSIPPSATKITASCFGSKLFLCSITLSPHICLLKNALASLFVSTQNCCALLSECSLFRMLKFQKSTTIAITDFGMLVYSGEVGSATVLQPYYQKHLLNYFSGV